MIKKKKDPLVEREKMRINMMYLHRKMHANTQQLLKHKNNQAQETQMPAQVEMLLEEANSKRFESLNPIIETQKGEDTAESMLAKQKASEIASIAKS